MPPPHVVKTNRRVLFSKIAVCSAPVRVTDPGANVSLGVRIGSGVGTDFSGRVTAFVSPELSFF